MRVRKSDFDAGSPYSCWLREEVCAEINEHLHNGGGNGLIKKHKAYVDEDSEYIVMNLIKSLDDYPEDLRKVAIDIIRDKLDPTFEK